MRILVTGSQGFVGRHLVKALVARGDDVYGFDIKSPSRTSLAAFLGDYRALVAYDAAVHLAANIINVNDRMQAGIYAFDDLLLDYNFCSWVQMSMNMNPAMRVVLLSSCAIDGKRDPYSAVKRTLESMASALFRKGVNMTVLRPFSGYGGDQTDEYPFPAIMHRAMRREDPLVVWGGEQVRDWLYIDDLVAGVIHAIDGRFPNSDTPVELGTGFGVDFYHLAEMMAEAVGYTPKVVGDKTKETSSEMRIARPLIATAYGWKATVGLEEGIRKSLEIARGM